LPTAAPVAVALLVTRSVCQTRNRRHVHAGRPEVRGVRLGAPWLTGTEQGLAFSWWPLGEGRAWPGNPGPRVGAGVGSHRGPPRGVTRWYRGRS
jgi:hypothetical protein